MWRNERRIRTVRNIILFILIAAIVTGLGYAAIEVRKGNAVYDSKLSEVSKQQQELLNAEKQRQVEDIQAEYDKDMETVDRYMPGIVCWGDSLTAGSYGNVSYPDVLKDYIDKNICDVYDFYTTIDASAASIQARGEYPVDIPVVNMGSGSDTTGTVLGRSGAAPFLVSRELIVPADRTDVQIHFTCADGSEANPLTGGDVGMNEVSVAGIKGTLSLRENKYYFCRSEEGAETTVPKDTELVTAASGLYRNYIHVVWIGAYTGFETTAELVEQVKTLLSRQSGNTERFIVIGPGSYYGKWETKIDILDRIDAAMTAEFGNRYINLRKYLCTDGFADAGMSPTAADKIDIKINAVPESFRSTNGSVDFSARTYNLLGKLVYERMDKLGYFDEITAELGIR